MNELTLEWLARANDDLETIKEIIDNTGVNSASCLMRSHQLEDAAEFFEFAYRLLSV